MLAVVHRMRCTMYFRTSWRCSYESYALLCRVRNSVELLLGLGSQGKVLQLGRRCEAVSASVPLCEAA